MDKPLEVFSEKHKTLIDKLADGCPFEYWRDDMHIDFTDNVYTNNFADRLDVSSDRHIICVGRGFWEEGQIQDDFLGLRGQVYILSAREAYDVEDVFLQEARTYLEQLRSAKGA